MPNVYEDGRIIIEEKKHESLLTKSYKAVQNRKYNTKNMSILQPER